MEHKATLNNIEKAEIIPCILSYHKRIIPQVNSTKILEHTKTQIKDPFTQ